MSFRPLCSGCVTSPTGNSGVPHKPRETNERHRFLVLLVSAVVTFAAGEIGSVAVHRLLASDDSKATSTRSLAIDAESIESRLLDSASYLASDELEGRGVGTEGLDRAAEYIADTFTQAGLQTELYGGKPFHVFHRSGKYVLGSRNALHFAGPKSQQVDLKLDTDYRPLSMSSSGRLSGEVVFAG